MGEFLRFKYHFRLADGKERSFLIELDPRSLTRIVKTEGPYPKWTELGFNQCSNCPLSAQLTGRCPVAVGLLEVVDFFSDTISYEKGEVTLETPERSYSAVMSIQEGLSSMVGLCMATSGCPVLAKLKPMARFHLPFANEEETIYRALSMYLAAQFFRMREGWSPDWELKGLVEMYDDIRLVNKAVTVRLSSACSRDASANALVKLDCFAMTVNFSVTQHMIEELRYLFNAYLQ